jgi:hypothetical protein
VARIIAHEHHVDADGEPAAGAVIHHHLLAEDAREFMRDDARRGIGRAPRRLRHDVAYRPVRILCVRVNRGEACTRHKKRARRLHGCRAH